MPEVKVNSLVKLYTLLLLGEGPKHGYELIKSVGLRLGQRISPGLVYPFLESLRKKGLVEGERKGARERRSFRLTPRGRAFVRSLLNRFSGLLEIAIAPKLTECAHCGCKVFEGGVREKVRGKPLRFCCHHCAMSFIKSRG